MITVKTDVLDLTINTRGDVEQALPWLTRKHPFQRTVPAAGKPPRSLSIRRKAPDRPRRARINSGERPASVPYNVEKEAFVLADGQNEPQVPIFALTLQANPFTKTFVLSVAIMG